jgi:antitoxin component HigA of HigAB toxin-antitoxin module
MTPNRALVRLNDRMLRRQGWTFATILATFAYATAEGYRTALSGPDRQQLVRQLASNPGFQALYGIGRQLDTVAGFSSWRFSGTSAVIAAVWGILASTRVLAGEEDDEDDEPEAVQALPHETLGRLMEARGLDMHDIEHVFGNPAIAREALSGSRKISRGQAKALGQLFQVPPKLFLT